MATVLFQRAGSELKEIPLSGGVAASEFVALRSRVVKLGEDLDREVESLRTQAAGMLPKSGGNMTGPVGNLKLAGGLAAGLYDASCVSTKWVKDNAPIKLAGGRIIHVDAERGSDTEDLFQGRGESSALPFKSLEAAVNWSLANYTGRVGVEIRLHTDVTVTGNNIWYNPNIAMLQISSADAADIKTITLASGIGWRAGGLILSNIGFHAASAIHFFIHIYGADNSASLRINNGVSFSGPVNSGVLLAAVGGRVLVNNAVSGNVTGPKYSCVDGGMIVGASKLPGSLAGVCDANSKAFG